MELDDLKNSWKAVNNQVKVQADLTPASINRMIATRYNARLKKVVYPEITGMIVCIAAAAYILFNFIKLDTLFLQGTGLLSILLLCTLPAISFASLRPLYVTGDLNKSYAETLKAFARQKIGFYKLQRINITVSYLLLVTTIILFSKFFSGKDITQSRYFWIFSFTLGYIFLSFYSKLVLKYYKKNLTQAEELLEALQP